MVEVRRTQAAKCSSPSLSVSVCHTPTVAWISGLIAARQLDLVGHNRCIFFDEISILPTHQKIRMLHDVLTLGSEACHITIPCPVTGIPRPDRSV